MAVMSVGREVILWPERVLFFAVRQWELGEIRGKGGRAYSASNWLGRIKSASRSRFL